MKGAGALRSALLMPFTGSVMKKQCGTTMINWSCSVKVGDLVRHIHPRMRHKLHVITYIDDTFVRINGGGGLFGRKLFEAIDENR